MMGALSVIQDYQRRYRALIENSSDAIYILDFDFRFIESNSKGLELLCYTEEELKKFEIEELTVYPTRCEQMLENMLVGKHAPLFEQTLIRKDGQAVDVALLTPIAGGEFVGGSS